MNAKIAFRLAAFVFLDLANATDAHSRPVDRGVAGRYTSPVGVNPLGGAANFADPRGQEIVPPALDDAPRGVLRSEVQHLGVESPVLRGRDDTPPALDDVERGASRADVRRPLDIDKADSHTLGVRDDALPALKGAGQFPADPAGKAAELSSAQSDSAREQYCIFRNIDFGKSTVGALMTRGFPLFTDFGLDMGKIGDAYFELEPMYEINMANWKEYTAGYYSFWKVWETKERKYDHQNGLDSNAFLHSIGYAGLMSMDGALKELARFAFEKLYPTCSLNTSCREAVEFARSIGAEPSKASYRLIAYSGPLNMKTPFSTDFHYTDQDGVKFTEEYLEALEALPEVYDRETYLAFGRRFGLGRSMSSIQFSNTDVFVAGEEYITMGSKNYEGQECVNPEPGGVEYTRVDGWLLRTLSPIQKARLETLNDNVYDMMPTASKKNLRA